MTMPEKEYPVSEYSALFPKMPEDDYALLVASIREQGLLEPITLWRSEVIDGRHRLRACREAGVAPRFDTLEDETDPVQYVLAKNVDRRHLDNTERGLIACDLSLMSGPGGDRRSAEYHATRDQPAFLPVSFCQPPGFAKPHRGIPSQADILAPSANSGPQYPRFCPGIANPQGQSLSIGIRSWSGDRLDLSRC